MNAFIVEAKNQPGELARVSGALAAKGINIQTGSVLSLGAIGGFGFITNDEAGTRSALDGAHSSYREVEVIPISVADEPGALAEIARKLGDAGINIELLLATGMTGGKMNLAIGVDKVEAARGIIGAGIAAPA